MAVIDFRDVTEVFTHETPRAHGRAMGVGRAALASQHGPDGPPGQRSTNAANGIFWVLATGAPWRDLPERFGPWQTVYDHFRTWRKSGVFAAIIETLQVKLDRDGY